MTNINVNRGATVCFKDIPVGDIFEYDEELYIKIHKNVCRLDVLEPADSPNPKGEIMYEFTGETHDCNAFILAGIRCRFAEFEDDTEVYVINCQINAKRVYD